MLGLIACSLIYSSIPSFVYLITGIVLLNQIQNYERSALNQVFRIQLFLITYAGCVFVIKVFISIAIAVKLLPYNAAWCKSFGFPLDPDKMTVWSWISTLVPELAASFCLIILMIINSEMKHFAKKESEMLIKVVPTPKDLHHHYQFWCYFCLICTLIHAAAFPSFFSFIYLTMCIGVVCFWFNHFKIEEGVFSVASRIIFWGTLLNVVASYIIFIEFIYELYLPAYILIIIGVPYLETKSSIYIAFEMLFLLLMVLTSTIYIRMRRRISKMKRLQTEKNREKVIRHFGEVFAQAAEG